MIDHLSLSTFDIIGCHTGALASTEITLRRPDTVRRIVLIDLPILTQEEIDASWHSPGPSLLRRADLISQQNGKNQ